MRRRRLLIAIVLVAAALMFMPMRLIAGWVGIDDTGITARRVSGTMWDGRFDQARAGPFDLGTFDAGVRPLPLLVGRAVVDIARTPNTAATPIAGAIISGIGERGVEAISGEIAGGTLGGLPVDAILFESASVRFVDGQCRTASGRVTIRIGLSIAGLELRNGLAGTLRCEGASLATTLIGQSGLERIALTIDADGSYVARLLVQSPDPTLGAALSAAGFGPTAEGFVRTMRGRF